MLKDKRQKRDRHALDEDGMVLCNPRDKEAAHRAQMEGIATDDRGHLPQVPRVALPTRPRQGPAGREVKLRLEVNMADASDARSDDPYLLNRFLLSQADDYEQALSEIKSGRKLTHWMWYIFPQIDGLGFSSTAKHYAIKSLDEARAYLAHPILGPRLLACAEAAVSVEGRTAREIFGTPDDLKLRSCATLFACISPAGSVFHRLLEKFYQGKRDDKTLQLLGTSE